MTFNANYHTVKSANLSTHGLKKLITKLNLAKHDTALEPQNPGAYRSLRFTVW